MRMGESKEDRGDGLMGCDCLQEKWELIKAAKDENGQIVVGIYKCSSCGRLWSVVWRDGVGMLFEVALDSEA